MIEINCEVFDTCADALAAESRGPRSGASKRVAIQKGDAIMVVSQADLDRIEKARLTFVVLREVMAPGRSARIRLSEAGANAMVVTT